MVPYIKGETQAMGNLKQYPEANIWTQKGWGVKKAIEKIHSLYRSPNTRIARVLKSKD